MEPLVADLITRLHPLHSVPITSGVEVKTPRGYGLVVGEMGDGFDNRTGQRFVIVELDGGERVPFLPDALQAVDHAA